MSETTRMGTVFEGARWEAQLLQGRLGEDDIPAYLPDANVKRVDPFITGANPLAVKLQVPASALAHATTVIDDYLEKTRPDPAASPPDDEEASRRAGMHFRWAVAFTVLVPFLLPVGVWYGVRYLRTARRLGKRPPGLRTMLAATLLVLATGAGVGLWLLLL